MAAVPRKFMNIYVHHKLHHIQPLYDTLILKYLCIHHYVHRDRYSGEAGDSLGKGNHPDSPFSTYDNDNDNLKHENCAKT